MTLRKLQLTGAAFAALAMMAVPSTATTPKSQSVTVVNPQAKPVITRVTNTVLTVDADNPDRNPFRAQLCQEEESAPGSCDVPNTVSAPPDRDIIIDTFSGECSAENAGSLRALDAYIDFGGGTFEKVHMFHPTYATPPGSSHTIHRFHFQTRLHVPANGRLAFSAASPRSTGTYLAYCRYFVSGYSVIP